MLIAFFESIKYVGHLFPVALLRVYVGSYYLNQAISHYGSDFLSQPRLAEAAMHWAPRSLAPEWYKWLIQQILVPNWFAFSYGVWVSEIIIAISFILGYFVRPTCVLGMALTLNFVAIYGPENKDLHWLFFVIFLTLAWLGAGRCLGLDYYYYKRRRGLWW